MKMEDIPQIISATAQTVGQKAVGLWEEGRLVIRIKDLEREMNRVYAEIGKKQVERARAQFDAETENQAGMLDAMKEEYAALKSAYARARGEKFCPHCTAVNRRENEFCGRCGAPLK